MMILKSDNNLIKNMNKIVFAIYKIIFCVTIAFTWNSIAATLKNNKSCNVQSLNKADSAIVIKKNKQLILNKNKKTNHFKKFIVPQKYSLLPNLKFTEKSPTRHKKGKIIYK